MAKKRTEYICTECGYRNAKSLGKCPTCNNWNTMVEVEPEEESKNVNAKTSITSVNGTEKSIPKPLNKIVANTYDRLSTGVSEFDRVLGGGLVRGGVVIVTAEPGTGKSTILLQTSDNVAKLGKKVLYISGEENEGQIKSRGERLKIVKNIIEEDVEDSNVYVVSETNLERILKHIDTIKPDLIIIDSLNTLFSDDCPENAAGEKVQMKKCGQSLISYAKKNEVALIFVGQQTKENKLAGIREIEHAVDAVIYFESDKNSSLRIMRPSKNRFGNTDEIGLFEMREEGLIAIENPSEIFVTQREQPVSGVALTVSLEGNRPLVVEIESLVRPTFYPNPTIVSEQVKKEKLNTLIAIAGLRGEVKVEGHDLFVQVTGGLKISEPSTSLGVLMSIISSSLKKPISNNSVFMGEVSLAGDIKKVGGLERRLKELDKLGFKYAYIPKNNYNDSIKLKNLKIIEVSNVKDVIQKVF